ncbi:MAG: nucleoside-diphosphate sugar epimerase/dehydratase [Trueperaceae bacterium]|nr:nucleoside-diphosphate sugar epimerase/dehydratase [Trueperaceae bacterium]
MPTKTEFGSPSATSGVKPAVWLSRRLRTGFVDLVLWSIATVGAFALRYDGRIPDVGWVVAVFAALTSMKLIASTTFGLHRQSWRRFSFLDAPIVAGAMASVGVVATVTLLVAPIPAVPIGLPLVDALLSLVLMLGARGGVRYLDEDRARRAPTARRTRNVLLVGAGEAGSIMVREILRHPETGMNPVGFLDDDPGKAGIRISSVPVLGKVADIADAIVREGVDEVLICVPSADGGSVRSIIERARGAAPHVVVRTIPALHELLSGKVQINRIRSVTIDDLLRRPTVELDVAHILDYLHGKRVMVTGAGGSIGSELVRQICKFQPKELILFGHGENSIYQLERELDVDWPGIKYRSVIAAVQNVVRLENVFNTYHPEVIFHTAAHKHVPLMEQNPEEAVFNNIVGSRNLVELAVQYGVTHFVNISTDKAVNPTSVMGASKRIVEMLVESASRRATSSQTFVSVRFGNVLGSRGSAVPIFKKQIAAGGPVTVTHPDMVRYFMTIPEAARLVLQASAHGTNGEIYILDMGEPVKVLDLVKDLIRLSGLEPDSDIPIVFTGTRPGEKLYEELMTESEQKGRTSHEKIFVAQPQPMDTDALERTVDDLTAAALASDGEQIRVLLSDRIAGARLQFQEPRIDEEPPMLA